MTGANSPLVIAENGDLAIAVVVELDLLGHGPVLHLELLKKLRHGPGSVVSTEHLGCKPRHVAGKMLVELRSLQMRVNGQSLLVCKHRFTYRQPVEDVIPVFLWRLLEHLEVLE